MRSSELLGAILQFFKKSKTAVSACASAFASIASQVFILGEFCVALLLNRAQFGLHLSWLQSSSSAGRQAGFPRPRNCHGDLERQASSTTHCEPADKRYPPAPRLESAARNTLLLKYINRPRFTGVSGLASRPLTNKCGVGRETVVLPNAAVRDEPAQTR
jgi:hypothetical protein